MRSRNVFLVSLITVGGCLSLLSCSSPADKAKKIEEGLSQNGKVLYKDVVSENPQLVTYTMRPDSSIVSLVYDLKSDRVDTLIDLRKGVEIVEVVPVEDGFLNVFREKMTDGKERFLYLSAIIRNVGNPKERSQIFLNTVDGREEIWATSYVIDRDNKKITLSSYEVTPSSVDIFRTMYDFKGNKIVDEPVHVNIPTPQTYSSSSNQTTEYIWECQKCGEKRTSAKKPSILEFTCHGNGEREGFGNSHSWVKVGKIE